MINRNSKTRRVQLKALKPTSISHYTCRIPQFHETANYHNSGVLSSAVFVSAQTFECRVDEVFPFAVINVTGSLIALVHKQEFSCLIQPFVLDHGFK